MARILYYFELNLKFLMNLVFKNDELEDESDISMTDRGDILNNFLTILKITKSSKQKIKTFMSYQQKNTIKLK